jgi:hypothetical protein
MEMFNKASIQERIGDMRKSKTLNHLADCEKVFLKLAKRYKIETAYDVVANELPYFKTIQYTEWAHSFSMNPLQQMIRCKQVEDAYADNATIEADYMSYFKEKALSGTSNKYDHIKDHNVQPRKHIIIPVGSNKLKETICANKLCYLRDKYENDIWFKPHPLTTHALVGELKDMLGDIVLDRDINMYKLLAGCEHAHLSHMTESAVYAVALGKKIKPIDVYNVVHQGSFYHINKNLFNNPDPAAWMQKALNSPKSGIVNPELQEDWELRMNMYFEYIMDLREQYKYDYVSTTGGYDYK